MDWLLQRISRNREKVLVLERRSIVGGSVRLESFAEGFTVDFQQQTGGTLRPDIINNLNFRSMDGCLPVKSHSSFLFSMQVTAQTEHGDYLVIDSDPAKAAESIVYSEKDARRWPEFVQFMDKAAHILAIAYSTIMPRLQSL